jgi:hypothetical protein
MQQSWLWHPLLVRCEEFGAQKHNMIQCICKSELWCAFTEDANQSISALSFLVEVVTTEVDEKCSIQFTECLDL